MKKFLQNVLLRSLCVLTFGILLLVFSADMPKWIVSASGGLFIVLGVAALIGFVRIKREHRPSVVFPIVSLGCVLFGVVQVLFPSLFFGIIRYLLAVIMLLLAVVQFYSLIVVRKAGVQVSGLTYLLPFVGIGVSVFVTFYKGFVENDPRFLLILGVGFIVYALLELWMLLLVKRSKDQDSEIEMESNSENPE